MDRFEELLSAHWAAVERYVRFRLPPEADADDILQEVWLTACQRFGQLKNQNAFKAWVLSIARNKCADYFRRTAGRRQVSLDALEDWELPGSRYGGESAVSDTLELLDRRAREILYLRFWEELPQAEIAGRLGVPVGTVKAASTPPRSSSGASTPVPTQYGKENFS